MHSRFKLGNKGGGRKRLPEAERNIKKIAREYTEIALNALIEVAGTGKSPGARVAAAVALLDRGWDKPRQDMGLEHSTTERVKRVITPAPSPN